MAQLAGARERLTWLEILRRRPLAAIDKAADIIAATGLACTLGSVGPGEARFVLVFETAGGTTFSMPVRAKPPARTDAPALLCAAASEIDFLEYCDGLGDWADELDLDPTDPGARDEYAALAAARQRLLSVVGEEALNALKTEIVIAQAIGAAHAAWQSNQDES